MQISQRGSHSLSLSIARFILFILLPLVFLASCGSDPKRVHTTASVPRGFVFDNTGAQEEEYFMGFGSGISRGASWSDEGNAGEAGIGDAQIEFKPGIDFFTLGMNLYGAVATGQGEDTETVGFQGYSRLRLLKLTKFSANFWMSYTHVTNEEEGKSCSRDFEALDCSAENRTITSSAQVKIDEFRFAPMLENHFNNRASIALVPVVKHTRIRTTNALVNNPTIEKSANLTTPGSWLYFIYRFSAKSNPRFMLQGGLGWSRERDVSDMGGGHEDLFLAEIRGMGGLLK